MKYKFNGCDIDSQYGSPTLGIPSGIVIPAKAGDIVDNGDTTLIVEQNSYVNIETLVSSPRGEPMFVHGTLSDGMLITDKVNLILARVEILKLKADDYTWACHVPDKVKEQLEKTLIEIDSMLERV